MSLKDETLLAMVSLPSDGSASMRDAQADQMESQSRSTRRRQSDPKKPPPLASSFLRCGRKEGAQGRTQPSRALPISEPVSRDFRAEPSSANKGARSPQAASDAREVHTQEYGPRSHEGCCAAQSHGIFFQWTTINKVENRGMHLSLADKQAAHPSEGRRRQTTAMEEAKQHTARSLVGRLRGAAAAHDVAATAEVVAEVRLVTKDDPLIRVPLADAGAVPFLAAQLTSSAAPTTAADAAAALLNISISAREQLMSAPGLLDALTAALLRADAAHHAAATVHSLLCVEAHRAAVGARRPLLAALVSLLRASPGTRATKDALKALFGVALYPPNRAALVALGVVQPLFALVMTDGRAGIVEDVTAVIAQVAGCAESLDAFRWMSGVRILLDLLEPGGGGAWTPRTRENAAAALLNLIVAGGDRAVAEVIAVGGAEEAVRELAEDDAASPRGKAKAEALLRALDQGAAAATATAKRREHRLADFLNGLVQSDPYISSPSSASTHG